MTTATRTALATPEPTGGGRMAGRRRAVDGRTTTKPTRAERRFERRRRWLVEQLGKAKTPTQRVAAAVDAIRMAMVDMPPEQAELVADQVVSLARQANAHAKPAGAGRGAR